MALRVMAISAPGNQRGLLGKHSLKSEDPASLYNACRQAGSLAANGIGSWGRSNWAGSRTNRFESTLMMTSFEDDLISFKEKIEKIHPNLLLIGSMTICFPGAIACAKLAREILKDSVCIVLGGRHASESIYINEIGIVTHHASSPLLLMETHEIDKLFDIVISGEGEYIIAWIGEIIDKIDCQKKSLSKIKEYFCNTNNIPGKWILGSIIDDKINTILSPGIPSNKDLLPSPCEIFGVHSSFDVFEGRMTAHVFSDIGSGCVFDCNFCSERRNITGPIAQLDTSAMRLYNQIKSAVKVISEDYPLKKPSAFIEDSTILAGSAKSIKQLIKLLQKTKIDIRFGGQFTVDQIFEKIEILKTLKEAGLDYLFIGIETLDPKIIGGMSKDINNFEQNWIDRVEKVITLLFDLNIKCGAAILFGLGEKHKNRIHLLQKIKDWRIKFNSPHPISINWAVQHPLCGNDGGMNYKYINWGITSDEWLEVFSNFGEASVLYPIAGQKYPVFEEVKEISRLYQELL